MLTAKSPIYISGSKCTRSANLRWARHAGWRLNDWGRYTIISFRIRKTGVSLILFLVQPHGQWESRLFLCPLINSTKLSLIFPVPNSSPYLMDKRSDGSMSNSMSSGVLSGDMPLSSSSSCTSSAPSTPAPVGGPQQPSPGVHAIKQPNFSYPGKRYVCLAMSNHSNRCFFAEVPAVTVEEA